MSPKPTIAFTASALILLLAVAAPALRAEEVSDVGPGALAHASADALLQQGKVEEAAQAYLAAVRAEPKNAAYRDDAMALKRVVGLRQFVASNAPSERWQRAVYSLHLFYLQKGLGSLAVDVDRKAHEALGTAETAAWLAEACLAAGMNAEATNLLAAYSGTSPKHAVYHAIALARLGHADAATRIAQGAAVVDVELTPADEYDRARMWTLLGRTDAALALLRSTFEKTPAPALAAWKDRARSEADFASLAALPAWPDVLKTASKVAQTCSGGSSCASCPNRGKCGGG